MLGEKSTRRREYPGPMAPCVMIRARSPSQHQPERLILENRRKEEIMAQMARGVAAQRKSDMHTDWLTHGDRKAWLSNVRSELSHRLHVYDLSVDDRREKLRKLLSQEEKENIAAMEEAEETILDRQAKMRARIKSLREKREKDRLEFVQEKYDQQFRAQCDELRSTLSKREQDMVCAERVEQLKEKEQQAKDRKVQKALFDELWEKDRQEKVKREEREAIAAHEKNRDMLDTLQKQKAALETQKEEAKKLKEDELLLLKEQEALRKMEDKAAQEEKRRRQQETRDLLDLSLRTKMRKKAREEQEQLAFDLKMLEQLLEESRNEAKERVERKMQLREEDHRYREYLKHLLEEEQEKERELERLLQEKCEADYQKQIDNWKAQRHMHQRLLDDVMAGRQKQIQERLEENERHKAQLAKDYAEMLRILEQQRQYELEEARKRKADNIQYQTDLHDQIREKQQAEEERRRFLDYEYRMGLQTEKENQEKVKHLLDHATFERLHPMRRRALMMQKGKEPA